MKKAQLHLAVYVALLGLLYLTVWAANFDFGAGNTVIAVGVAVIKAALVGLFFMELVETEDLDSMAAIMAIVMLGVLFCLSLADVYTRGWFPI